MKLFLKANILKKKDIFRFIFKVFYLLVVKLSVKAKKMIIYKSKLNSKINYN